MEKFHLAITDEEQVACKSMINRIRACASLCNLQFVFFSTIWQCYKRLMFRYKIQCM